MASGSSAFGQLHTPEVQLVRAEVPLGIETACGTLTPARAQVLGSGVARHEVFADDRGDEFTVEELGAQRGIFKVWAGTTIAELEEQALDSGRRWAEVAGTPATLHQSLERWRSFTEAFDRRLQIVYASRPLPEEPEARSVELYHRLRYGLAVAGPFYSLEALVVDPREHKPDNPINFDEQANGGALDTAGMFLPSLLGDRLVAQVGDWRGLDWTQIDTQVAELRQAFNDNPNSPDAQKFVYLNRIAAMAGVDVATVIFAANTLEYIPASVGGKSSDLSEADAILLAATAFGLDDVPSTTLAVAQDANAKIRFRNWTPVVRSGNNFSGKFLSYDAVCATAAKLVEHAKQHPEAVVGADNAEWFVKEMLPQLDGLDAASAKGRYMLDLLYRGIVNNNVIKDISVGQFRFASEVSEGLRHVVATEAVRHIGDAASAQEIGGKAVGLQRAVDLYGSEQVLGGQVLSTDAVYAYLESIPGCSDLIRKLQAATEVDHRLQLANEITEKIRNSPLPEDLTHNILITNKHVEKLVLRSSSADEDVDVLGPAPGIYESEVGVNASDQAAVDRAIRKVIESYFSPKAISYRHMLGLQHDPHMAVIIQEYITGPGGSLFVRAGELTLNVAGHPDSINDHTGGGHVEQYSGALESSAADAANSSRYLTGEHIATLKRLAKQAAQVYGDSDIEYVLDGGDIKVLQLRRLAHPKTESRNTATTEHLTVVDAALGDAVFTEVKGKIGLRVSSKDVDSFQGNLFRWLVRHRDRVGAVVTDTQIPETSHFANVMGMLGIAIINE